MSRWMETVRGTERCLVCGEWFEGEISWSWMIGLTNNRKLCMECAGKLLPIQSLSCTECGRPQLKHHEGEGNEKEQELCLDCQRWSEIPPWDRAPFLHRALYIYNDFLQEVLAQFKYRGDTEIGMLFAEKIKKQARKLGRFDFVSPIPLNDTRHWERGFNQAEALAQYLSPMNVLKRTNESTEKQSKRSRQERLQALQNAFTMNVDQGTVKGKTILLVDDIYTTGATLRSAAKVLYDHEAKKVAAITVARAVGSQFKGKLKEQM